MPTHDHESGPPRELPAEKSFWELVPRRNLRRAVFLIVALAAILAIKKMGGFSLAKLFNDVAPGPTAAPATASSEAPFRRIEVKPK